MRCITLDLSKVARNTSNIYPECCDNFLQNPKASQIYLSIIWRRYLALFKKELDNPDDLVMR